MPIETISSSGASRSGRTSGRCALFDRADARSARFNFTADEGDRFRRDGKVETIEAPYLRRRSEPGELALGELARRKYPAIAQFVAIDLSLEKLPRLPISDAAHRRAPLSASRRSVLRCADAARRDRMERAQAR